MRRSLRPVLVALLAFAPPSRTAESKPDDATFYEKDVRPLLQAHCLTSRGGGPKIRGGLRPPSGADVLRGGAPGPAVNVDKPAESMLLKAINQTDDDLKMPPKGKLSPAQIDVL